MRMFALAIGTLLLVAVVAGASMAATAPARPQAFWVRGTVVSFKDNALVIKVTSAPASVTRYEQKGELTVMLAPKAAIRMGAKTIDASAIKPSERVYVSGTYRTGQNPTFEATSIRVYSK